MEFLDLWADETNSESILDSEQPKKGVKQGTKFPFTVQLSNENKWDEFSEWAARQFEQKSFTYIVAGLEVAPTTNQLHAQGYVEFPPHKKTTCVGARKRFDPWQPHMELAVSGPAENREYCLKPDSSGLVKKFIELGIARVYTQEGPGKRAKMDWARQHEIAKSDFLQCDPRLQIQYFGNLQKISHMAGSCTEDVESLDNWWLYGNPGTGKSRLSRLMAKELDPTSGPYMKDSQTKWWDGYGTQRVVIIEELEAEAKYMGHLLKRAADRYPFKAEMKGAYKDIRPKHIIVNSNYRIEDIWQDPMLVSALKRRFKVVHVQTFEEALGMWKTAAHETESLTIPLPTAAVPGFNPA